MHRIYYSNDSFLTGDEIARVLLDYAAALARREASETVTVPILLDDGERSEATLLIGPASQIVAEKEHTVGAELVDEAFVAGLEDETRKIGPNEIRLDEQVQHSTDPTRLDLD